MFRANIEMAAANGFVACNFQATFRMRAEGDGSRLLLCRVRIVEGANRQSKEFFGIHVRFAYGLDRETVSLRQYAIKQMLGANE